MTVCKSKLDHCDIRFIISTVLSDVHLPLEQTLIGGLFAGD